MAETSKNMAELQKPKSFMDQYRAPLAEFVATTMFVWVGCGVAVSVQSIPVLNPNNPRDGGFSFTIGTAFGLAISVLVYAIAPISGGHINPAVTFAFVIGGKMAKMTGLLYVIAQCLGAILGASIVWGSAASPLLTDDGSLPPFNVGMNVVQPTLPSASAFLGEAMGTFLLVFTVLLTAVYPKSIAQNLAPIAIGWSVLLAHLLLIPLTGCGINPARSLGPMLVTIFAGGKAGYRGWWVYYTAPFVGSLVAVAIGKYIFEVFDKVEEDELEGKMYEQEVRAAQQAGALPAHDETVPMVKTAGTGDDEEQG